MLWQLKACDCKGHGVKIVVANAMLAVEAVLFGQFVPEAHMQYMPTEFGATCRLLLLANGEIAANHHQWFTTLPRPIVLIIIGWLAQSSIETTPDVDMVQLNKLVLNRGGAEVARARMRQCSYWLQFPMLSEADDI